MNENEQGKEVYARYGLAMATAQALEYILVSAMVALDFVPNATGTTKSVGEAEQLFDAFVEAQFEKTLGKLIKTIGAVTPLPDELADNLKNCNRKRNWLAHHYFRERLETFKTEQGRAQMVEELRQARDLFERTFEIFERTLQPAYDKLDVTEE